MFPVVQSVVFDPSTAEFREDPYEQYAQLVRHNPIHVSPAVGGWVLAGYDDVSRGFRDLRLASQPRRLSGPLTGRATQSPTTRILSGMIGHLDPPLQTRIRGLIRQGLSQLPLTRLATVAEETVDRLIAALRAKPEFDLVEELARPLSVELISHVLGLPVEDAEPLRDATADVFRIFDPMLAPEVRRRIDQAVLQFRDFFLGRIGECRRSPGDDLLSRLVHGVHPELRMSDNDLVANCILIFVSGQQSPTNLISNSVLALSSFPHQWEVLLAGTPEIPTAMEELLRFASPAHFSARTTTEECEYGGQIIPRGEVVFLLNAAANRDPRQFEDPDRLNLKRTHNPHLSFGSGIHHCMGSEITRLILGTLLRRLNRDRLRLTVPRQPLHWKPYLATRGLQSLRVSWG